MSEKERIGIQIRMNHALSDEIRRHAVLDVDKSLQAFGQMVDYYASGEVRSSKMRITAGKFDMYSSLGLIYTVGLGGYFENKNVDIFTVENDGKYKVGVFLGQEYYVGFTSSERATVNKSKFELGK